MSIARAVSRARYQLRAESKLTCGFVEPNSSVNYGEKKNGSDITELPSPPPPAPHRRPGTRALNEGTAA